MRVLNVSMHKFLLFIPDLCEMQGLNVQRMLQILVCQDDGGVSLVIKTFLTDDILQKLKDLEWFRKRIAIK